MINLNTLFDNPIVKGLENNSFETTKAFSDSQRIAIVKAVLYIISADGVITEEEKQFFTQLCVELKADGNIMDEALALSDDVMFDTLKTVSDDQEAYILSCLNNVANIDNELVKEESKLIDAFSTLIRTGEKPDDFYTKILTF